MAKHLLILDLDETLVHGVERPLPGRAADFRVGPFHVYRRPHLDAFVAAAAEGFDLAVWSSASGAYVHGIVAALFPTPGSLRFVWSCERCTRRYDAERQEHFYAKNLSKLRRLGHALDRVLIVDDSPEKLAQHYGNLIRVAPFFGEEDDGELRALIPFLGALRAAEDVRAIEKRGWRTR